MTESDALLEIQELMSGIEWSADTLQEIVEVLIRAGYPVADIDEEF